MRSPFSLAMLLVLGLIALARGQPVSSDYELPMKSLVIITQSVLGDYPYWVLSAMQQPFEMIQVSKKKKILSPPLFSLSLFPRFSFSSP